MAITSEDFQFTRLAELEASALLVDEGGGNTVNWRYCDARANFRHSDPDACEFILHIGDPNEDDPYWEGAVAEMRDFGCTDDFIGAYVAAKDAGAVRLLVFV